MSNYEIKPDDFSFVQKDKVIRDEVYETNSYLKDVLISFRQNRGAVIGMSLIFLIALMAIFGPFMNQYKFDQVMIENASLPPLIPAIKNWPIIGSFFNGQIMGVDMYQARNVDAAFWFGTDTLGRDLFTRVWEGTRISLIIALTAVIIDIFIGMIYGLVSGYFGGKVDFFMQRFAEILYGIPTLVLVTLLSMILPKGIISIIVALMITGWIGMSRIARAQVLKLKEQEYILASKTLGASDFYVIFREILPNIFGQIIIMSMFSVPNAIFTEAYLSFVGLGVPAPLASLGSLISEGYKTITVYPYMIFFAVFILGVLMLSFNLFADGLRDAFDPKQKQM